MGLRDWLRREPERPIPIRPPSRRPGAQRPVTRLRRIVYGVPHTTHESLVAESQQDRRRQDAWTNRDGWEITYRQAGTLHKTYVSLVDAINEKYALGYVLDHKGHRENAITFVRSIRVWPTSSL